MDLDSIVAALADAVAARVVEQLNGPKTPERVPIARATEHGAPSARWVTARAREGAITIHGPRGGRFVWGNELAALLTSTTIHRRGRPAVVKGDIQADVRTAVAELLARRAG
jgi:hypothetical protein